MKHRILIVEDNIMLAGQQKKWLEKSGYEVHTTIDEPGARKRIKSEHFELILADVRLPEGDGISLLEWMHKEKIDIPFIVMTGYASVPDAVKAIKLGAKDYLAKPVQMEELLELIKDILRPKALVYGKDKDFFRRNSPKMLEVESLARTVAPFDITVLILGPNGAGKESVAQRIHYSSDRREKPLVAVNCAVIPKELAPTLFFGHVKGTFTGADGNKEGYFDLAKGGTLFLDEIGTLPPEVQAMLLRAFQEGTYLPIGSGRERKADVRIVAATNEDLQLAIREKRFREDLYHRLCEFEIVMPSLHECPEDILPLAEHFREKFSKELKKQTEGFTPEAARLMLSYRWPGNVRELLNKVKRAVLMTRQPVIEAAELNIRTDDTDGEINLFPKTEAEEKLSILKALKASGGHRRKAAEMLHIDPSTLYRKMKKYGLLEK
nr:MAG TPA: response regulator [Caudoviricetes sp.]